MTLEHLKKTATAGELCLINAVIPLVEKEIQERLLQKLLNFIGKNPIPSKEDHHFNSNAWRDWFDKMKAHFES